jgi:hypothetical protein
VTALVVAITALVAAVAKLLPESGRAGDASLRVGCRLDGTVRAGARLQLTYLLESSQAQRVGLGAGIYDDAATDHATGAGARDNVEIAEGESRVERSLTIPPDLERGRYELVAEVWPPRRLGAGGADVLAEAACTSFEVAGRD